MEKLSHTHLYRGRQIERKNEVKVKFAKKMSEKSAIHHGDVSKSNRATGYCSNVPINFAKVESN